MSKVDILAIAAHPDDVELGCAGTIISHIKKGYTAAVVDLTHGELGTRGTPEERLKEADDAAKVMGLSGRENLGLRDGFFENDEETQLKVIQIIRKYQPTIVLTNSEYDRHPDHGRGAKLVEDSFFKAGLRMIKTVDENGIEQKAHRPKHLYFMIQSIPTEPSFIVDISDSHPEKLEAIRQYKSQFFDPNSKEPETYISNPSFMNMVESRAVELGHRIQVEYGEGFTTKNYIGVSDLNHIK